MENVSSDNLQSFEEWDQTFPSNPGATAARQVSEKKMYTLVADCLKYLENVRLTI